jgi:NAD(P)-dependent dehydrogenase (short-subunit alcohol dehydrogenase family)
MTILITGSDSSLGAAMMESYVDHEMVVGIPMETMMEGKFYIEEEIQSIIEEHGKIDKVINNYGVNHLSWIGDTPLADAQILTLNVMAPYWVINTLVAAKQVCRVVNVASATYRVPQRCTSLYCASKAAVVQLTKVMARELAPKGWIINSIAPGLIEDTEMAKLTNDQVLELRGWTAEEADGYAKKMVPMGRYTNTAEVADAIWKILDLPDYINGTCIDCMGGV